MAKHIRALGVAASAILFATGFGSGEGLFAPSARLDPYWQKATPENTADIDHADWGAILTRYVKVDGGMNRFDYSGVTRPDRQLLTGYVQKLIAVVPSHYSRAVQKAYWINLYNALTVRTVLDHYPVKSIRDIDISPGLFADGPWDRKLVSIDGRDLSLNDIEHRILRPIWRDPRIHYAVNCASIGCPDLPAEPFTAANAETLLERAARGYINSPRGVSIRNGTITVSKIYDWFHEDFGGSDKDVFRHLLRYANGSLKTRLREIGKIEDTAYDWSLNDLRR